MLFGGTHHRIKVYTEVFGHIRQRQKPTAVHACLTVHVNHATGLQQKRVEGCLEPRIPGQDVHLGRINGIENPIPTRMSESKPHRRVLVRGTVNHMRNPVMGYKRRGENRTRSHKNPRVEPSRGLAEILGHHCLVLHRVRNLNGRTRALLLRRLHTSRLYVPVPAGTDMQEEACDDAYTPRDPDGQSEASVASSMRRM